MMCGEIRFSSKIVLILLGAVAGLIASMGLSGLILAALWGDAVPPSCVAGGGLLLFQAAATAILYWRRIHTARRVGQVVSAQAMRGVRVMGAQAAFLPVIICVPAMATARGATFQEWTPVLVTLLVAGLLVMLSAFCLTRAEP
ncbi:hypothetical protein [Nitrospirillum sp. BR 11828]|uniref:hypothetical protein n=1 Tax=Nitrospirillum sp. BR 11828 TaxID=3104325 RepID=UPI002ACA9A46|nr:hypothetical protein [Nitrospirillum sp. BR 11828]MDZ5648532.1 hypothetical protein [Nitrospirillum sp. BR 11828]